MMTLPRAQVRAQRRFRSALAVYFRTGSWDTEEARLYLQSERLVGDLMVEADWETTKAELDQFQTADHDMHLQFRVAVRDCEDCCVDPEWAGSMTSAEFLAEIEAWTPGELQESFGR